MNWCISSWPSPPSGGRFATRIYIIHSVLRESEVITGMSEEQKKLIDETVDNLKHLNKESLLIVKSGTEMLKARDAMDREQEAEEEVS